MFWRIFEYPRNKIELLLFILWVWTAFAAPERLRAATQVDARLDTTRLRIGDPLTLTLSVRTDPGEAVRFPDLTASLGEFELLSSLPPQKYEEEQGATLEQRSYKVATFETGSRAVPGLPFVVMRTDGSVDTLYTPELQVRVVALVVDTTVAEVRPLKGLIGVPKLWHKLAAWGVAALALLGVLIYAWRRYLARREARLLEGFKPVTPSKPAHLAALDELDRIKSLDLIEKGEIKLFHILVSEAIRHYIARGFSVDALEMTTWELALALEGKNLEPGLHELISDFLHACDLVKFAKYKPQIVEINATFNKAYEIVEKSRPREVRPLDEEKPGEPSAPASGDDLTSASLARKPGVEEKR